MVESQNIEYKESWRDEYLRWICGFANAQGGRLFIGINDDKNVVGVANSHRLLEDIPNKIVTTLGIVCDVNLLNQEGKDYIEIVVEPSNMPIAYKGEYHYRSGATKQQLKGTSLQQFILKKMGMTWDDVVIENATIDEIDRTAIDYFVNKGIFYNRLSPETRDASTETILENLGLLSNEGKIKSAAILLFGKRPQRYFIGAEFRIGRFVKDEADLLIQDSIEGNLIQMADRVIEILKSKYLISPIHYEGMVRVEPLEIPEDGLREIIYNAICHKDYSGVHIQMKVYNDHVTLWNDGPLPDGFDMNVLMKEHSSRPRNKNIASTFYKAGFIEAWGRGIKKIQESFAKANLPMPTIENRFGGVLVTIQRNPLFGKLYHGETHNEPQKLTKRQIAILSLLRKDINISRKEIAKELKVSLPTIKRDMVVLRNKQFVIYAGSSKEGHWEILKDIE
jgi:ATP-dependent DNA helicase RecG